MKVDVRVRLGFTGVAVKPTLRSVPPSFGRSARAFIRRNGKTISGALMVNHIYGFTHVFFPEGKNQSFAYNPGEHF